MQLFDVVSQMAQREISKFNDNVNTHQVIFHSLYQILRRSYRSILGAIYQQYVSKKQESQSTHHVYCKVKFFPP